MTATATKPRLALSPTAASLPGYVTSDEDALTPNATVAWGDTAAYLDGERRLGMSLRSLKMVRWRFDEARKHLEHLRFGRPVCDQTDTCCDHRTPEILEVEAEDIANRFHSLPAADQETISCQVSVWLTTPLRTTDDAGIEAQAAEARHRGCPFYMKDEHRCGIAAAMPLQCRAYGVFNLPISTCTATLTRSETAERRSVLSYDRSSGWDRGTRAVAAEVARWVTSLIGFLVSVHYGVLSGFAPWLVYRKLAGRDVTGYVADAQAEAGAFVRPLTSYLAEPIFKRWGLVGAAAADVLQHEEDVQLAHEGKPPKWRAPIRGQDRLGLPAAFLRGKGN